MPCDGPLSVEEQRLIDAAADILQAIDTGPGPEVDARIARLADAAPGCRAAIVIQRLLQLRRSKRDGDLALTREEGVDEDPRLADKTCFQAQILMREGKDREALTLLERAFALDPGSRRVRETLVAHLKETGLELYGSGKVAEAVARWNRALELAPRDQEAREYIGRAESVIGRWDKAASPPAGDQ